MAEKKPEKEKVKQAIALEYDPNDEAPRVIASGRGALAERIIAYREEHGAFSAPEELMEVSGIGEGKYGALEGRITVNGE